MYFNVLEAQNQVVSEKIMLGLLSSCILTSMSGWLFMMINRSSSPSCTHIVCHGDLGRVELLVVAAPGRFVEEPSRDASHEQTVIYRELDHHVQGALSLLQQIIQLKHNVTPHVSKGAAHQIVSATVQDLRQSCYQFGCRLGAVAWEEFAKSECIQTQLGSPECLLLFLFLFFSSDQQVLALTFWACTMVLGKPSNKKPFLHSGLSSALSISSTTISSLTNFPSSIVWKRSTNILT